MKHKTGIQWSHVPGYVGATWNPSVGCTRVSTGCENCYAEVVSNRRFRANLRAAVAAGYRGHYGVAIPQARADGVAMPCPPQYDEPFATVQLIDSRIRKPLSHRAPHAYFVDSMSDLFHPEVPDDFVDRVLATAALAPRHLFMILTKRPERMRSYMTAATPNGRQREHAVHGHFTQQGGERWPGWPLPNLWLGATVEDQEAADTRLALVVDTPAAVRFISVEPQVGPVAVGDVMAPSWRPSARGIDWVIVGGESGQHARPFDLAWARSLRDECAAGGARFFMKQLGDAPVESGLSCTGCAPRRHDDPGATHQMGTIEHGPAAYHVPGGRDGKMETWPPDLRVRQFPAGHADWGEA